MCLCVVGGAAAMADPPAGFLIACVCIYICVFVCVCLCEGEKQRGERRLTIGEESGLEG